MFVVTGATGHTGSAAAEALLAKGERVRVVVRSAEKGAAWAARGAEVAVAEIGDADSLASAFAGATAVYAMNPPGHTSADPLAEAERHGAAYAEALRRAAVPHAVALSSIGSASDGIGVIATNTAIENALQGLPVTFLRASYFMENWASVIGLALAQGILPSMLLPLDRAIPMVAAADIGRTAADLMLAGRGAPPLIELAGPVDLSPLDVAAALAQAAGKPVQAVPVPRDQWEGVLAGAGFSPVMVRLFTEMLDGINAGRVDLTIQPLRGKTPIATVVSGLIGPREA